MFSRSALPLALLLLLVSAQAVESSSAGLMARNVSQGDAQSAITAAEASSRQAFLRVQAAGREGGNVTALAARFNEALELVESARVFMGEGLLDHATVSAGNAQRIFEAVGGEAEALRVQAAADASTRRTVVLLAAPFAAVLIAVFSYLLIRLWQRRRLERTLEMRVEEAGTQ